MKNYFICLLFLVSPILCFADNTDLLFSPKGVAEVHITLPDGMVLDQVERDVDTKAYMEVRNSDNSSYTAKELYSGYILMEGRGNTTWGTPKKPYNIDLINNAEEDNPSTLLGMPSHHKWCLITYYSDKSLMRIPLAYYLGQKMNGLQYSPRIHYVEFYVNGEYRGLYSLCEKIERGDDRVNIKKLTADAADQVEPRISGGYIIEVTPKDRLKPDQKSFVSTQNINFTFKYPKNKNVTNQQIKWINDYINSFEKVLYSNSFKDEENGYLKYINEDSFIDWYIIQEFSKNCDSPMHASVYMHKDRNGKLNMSAPWDFDIAFGNINYNDCFYEDGFHVKGSRWFNRLFQDERFLQKVIDRYDELMPLFNRIPAILKANEKQLTELGCVERNFDLWNILGRYHWPNYSPYPETHKGEVQRLIEWIESRKAWLYINFGKTEGERTSRLLSTRPTIRVMEPEKFLRKESSSVKAMRGYNYVWMWDDKTSTRGTENYSITRDGKHYVRLKDKNGNLSQISYPVTWGEELNYDYLDISTPTLPDFELYPNPAKNILYINYSASLNSGLTIDIYDLKGTLIKRYTNKTTTDINSPIELDISGIANGLYIIRIINETGVSSKKIIVSN